MKADRLDERSDEGQASTEALQRLLSETLLLTVTGPNTVPPPGPSERGTRRRVLGGRGLTVTLCWRIGC